MRCRAVPSVLRLYLDQTIVFLENLKFFIDCQYDTIMLKCI